MEHGLQRGAADRENGTRPSLVHDAVGRLDDQPRCYNGVSEISAAPDCPLRLGAGEAGRDLALGDGTRSRLARRRSHRLLPGEPQVALDPEAA